ncbi:unnamed protein product [Haemonchus placei]|uniref:TMEM135_C_rich domain-containing protein n=1 Tax=Haemonchus placei TaxID=6290 RepID=A0A0N4VT13_HAEPC|nr:unnamed protein product [Haemonchus placei]
MPVFSKLAYFLGLPTVNTNCYETMHTWQPHCNQAILDCFPNGVWFCLKTYAPFYLVTKRGDFRKVDWKRYCIDVILLALRYTLNFELDVLFFRHVLGFFTPISMGLISSMLGSFFSLLIEKRSRWPALALYLTNLASETLFRQLHNHGYIPKVNKGEVIPFIIGMGLFFSLYTAGRLNDIGDCNGNVFITFRSGSLKKTLYDDSFAIDFLTNWGQNVEPEQQRYFHKHFTEFP